MKSDAWLRKDVEDELACEPSVDAAAIGVAVKEGIVTLTGHVASYAEKVVAERTAARVVGVKAVVTELDVKLPGTGRVNDEEIAQAVIDALSWNTLIPKDRIRVEVGSIQAHFPPGSSRRGGCSLVIRSGNEAPASRRPAPHPLRSLRLAQGFLNQARERWRILGEDPPARLLLPGGREAPAFLSWSYRATP
ncbi:MAG: BON domain-containing protein [Acidobacteriia bacterium]|nr:BON domain-containing protein [Terriglobia bacterium]